MHSALRFACSTSRAENFNENKGFLYTGSEGYHLNSILVYNQNRSLGMYYAVGTPRNHAETMVRGH